MPNRKQRAEVGAGSPTPKPGTLTGTDSGMSLSMHDGVQVWCDCCSCEAEPYWAELADEMGIDLGSDYEDETSTDASQNR